MNVTFKRSGSRRYSITVERHPLANLEMDPAPGYDPLVPHDLLHLVVEARLGLTRGIFGQLAAGGDAGTFHLTSWRNNSTKEFARERKRLRERGEKLLREGRAQSAQSERATYICWQRWLSRSASHARRAVAAKMNQQAAEVRDLTLSGERDSLSEIKIEEICACLDKLSSCWSKLKIGESMSVSWPDLTCSICA